LSAADYIFENGWDALDWIAPSTSKAGCRGREVVGMSHCIPDPAGARPVHTLAEAGTYIKRVCFKHGPPSRIGLELEWLLHDPSHPTRYPDAETLIAALGPHAPRTLDPAGPARPLPAGGCVTIEPGGQVEISSAPAQSVPALIQAMAADVERLTQLLASSGFTLADEAADPQRPPRRLLRTPRYDAMSAAFDAIGPAGHTMMCATAATQVCIDLGTVDQAQKRWRAAHQLGPVLLAAFANSPRSAGSAVSADSVRMATWWQLDPARTAAPRPSGSESDYASCYVERVLDTQVLAISRPIGSWLVSEPRTLRDWLAGPEPVTTADIDLHLSMLFPPVRPQGYLELRYLDAQPGSQWVVPLGVVAALFARPERVRQVLEVTDPVASDWLLATESGLAGPALRSAASQIGELALRGLADLNVEPDTEDRVRGLITRRLIEAISPAADQLSREGSR